MKKRRKIRKRELYDLSLTFSKLIRDYIKEFRKNTTSYPSHLTYEEWVSILKEIQESFNSYIHYKENWEKYSEEEKEEVEKKLKKGFELLTANFEDLWW